MKIEIEFEDRLNPRFEVTVNGRPMAWHESECLDLSPMARTALRIHEKGARQDELRAKEESP